MAPAIPASARKRYDHLKAGAQRRWTTARQATSYWWECAVSAEPEEDKAKGVVGQNVARVTSFTVFGLLDINDRLIARYASDLPSRYALEDMDWAPGVQAAFPEIRKELVEYIDGYEVPHVAEIAGLDPHSEEGLRAAPADKGAWRTVIIYMDGKWVDQTVPYFPATIKASMTAKGVQNFGFTFLDGGSHLGAHVGPNRGALRYQLPIVVPGKDGDCRIRIGEEMVHWHEGESVIFDLSTNHEAWNDSDGLRVLLMIEFQTPMKFPLSAINKVAQYSYRYHPSHRGMIERAGEFEELRRKGARPLGLPTSA